jgi:hypothetical protein
MATPITTPFGFPTEHYHCLLDEQPHYLVPSRLLLEHEPAEYLIVNPRCWFSWHGPLPPDKGVRVAFAEHFCPSEWLVWVDDPSTGVIWPFWVGYEYMHYLGQLTPGYPVSIELPDHILWVLRAANIVVEPEEEMLQRVAWRQASQTYAAQFERGYTCVPDLIHPFHVGALRRYYRFHTRNGSFEFGDSQVERRYAAYDEQVASFFHLQLTQIVSDIAATVVRPSYSYFVAYQSDSELKWHTDREECEYSVSLCIDASPEPHEQNPWPLDLQTAEGMLRLWQYIGDAIVYRGRHLPHARERLPHGYSSSSLLFHYSD